MRLLATAGVAAAAAFASSCVPTEVCACDYGIDRLVLHGVVETADGDPLPGADMEVDVHITDCDGAPQMTLPFPRSDGFGNWEWLADRMGTAGCFVVRARPAEGSGFGPGEATVRYSEEEPLPFRTEAPYARLEVQVRVEPVRQPAGS